VGREKLLAGVINACQPDLVVLEEATRPEVVKTLVSACGMKWSGAHLGDSLAFMSRIDIDHYDWHRIQLGRRRYLEIVLKGGQARVFGVHLSAINSNVTERRRMYEVSVLLRQTAPYRDTFHVLTGDFNTLAEDATFDVRRLPPRLQALYWLGGGRIRWKALSMLLEAGYADGYRLLHHDPGYSFPTWDPAVRLDYLLVPSKIIPAVKACRVLYDAPGAKDASDHFPLLSEIALA
jgi:endonuclease/exonuclease/phosphatase family metal-dependent hydrolase